MQETKGGYSSRETRWEEEKEKEDRSIKLDLWLNRRQNPTQRTKFSSFVYLPLSLFDSLQLSVRYLPFDSIDWRRQSKHKQAFSPSFSLNSANICRHFYSYGFFPSSSPCLFLTEVMKTWERKGRRRRRRHAIRRSWTKLSCPSIN